MLNAFAQGLAGQNNNMVNSLTSMTNPMLAAQQQERTNVANQAAQMDMWQKQLQMLASMLGHNQPVAGEAGTIAGANPATADTQIPRLSSVLGNGNQPVQTDPYSGVKSQILASVPGAQSGSLRDFAVNSGLIAPMTRDRLQMPATVNPFGAGADVAQSQPEALPQQPQNDLVNLLGNPLGSVLATTMMEHILNPPATAAQLNPLSHLLPQQAQQASLLDTQMRQQPRMEVASSILNAQQRQQEYEARQRQTAESAEQSFYKWLQEEERKSQEREDALHKPVSLSAGSRLVNPQTGETIVGAENERRDSMHPVTLDIGGAPTPGVQIISSDGTSRYMVGGQEVTSPQTYYSRC
jgi:hypothetical protein